MTAPAFRDESPCANALRDAMHMLRLHTLDTRGSDRLDFHDIGIWRLRAALEAMYETGMRDATTQETPR